MDNLSASTGVLAWARRRRDVTGEGGERTYSSAITRVRCTSYPRSETFVRRIIPSGMWTNPCSVGRQTLISAG